MERDETWLVNSLGHKRLIGPRTAQLLEALIEFRDDIEKPTRGRVEITVDFADGTLKASVRKVGEARRMG